MWPRLTVTASQVLDGTGGGLRNLGTQETNLKLPKNIRENIKYGIEKLTKQAFLDGNQLYYLSWVVSQALASRL